MSSEPQQKAASGAYAAAGVDIAAGSTAMKLMAAAVQATFGPEVLSDVGAFGGLFSAAGLAELDAPVLVASTDGVGTKTKVAAAVGIWDTIGHDIVNHCLNDIMVQGARPLFFLDYVASARLDPVLIATIVGGVAAACSAAGCALLGGETAEMPGVYHDGAVDLVGTMVGVVDRARIVDGRQITAGDVILGLPSSGLHTNGFSLARRALADLDWFQTHVELETDQSLGRVLLAPHRSYAGALKALDAAGVMPRGLAHITGGGLIDNPVRIFPEGVGARLYADQWPVPPIFRLIQSRGPVDLVEMHHVFNMGLGMLVIVPPADARTAQAVLGDDLYVVGEMVAGPRQVEIVGVTDV